MAMANKNKVGKVVRRGKRMKGMVGRGKGTKVVVKEGQGIAATALQVCSSCLISSGSIQAILPLFSPKSSPPYCSKTSPVNYPPIVLLCQG